MTVGARTMRRPMLAERPILALLLVLLGALATAAATVAGNGNPVVGLIPIALAAAIYAFYVLPVRYFLFVLIFLSLTLDAVEEGPWSSPLAPIGTLLANNLNRSLPIARLMIPGVAVVLALMAAMLAYRSLANDRTDSQGRTPTALPLFAGLIVACATVFALIALGRLWGGDIQMAKIQVQAYLMLLVMAYIAAMSLRDVKDYRILGRVVVAAAVIRAFYVIFVVHHLSGRLPTDAEMAVAATHGDSLLFSAAAVLLVARFIERPSRRTAAWCALLLPVLVIGMQLNGRRLVWVELAVGVLILALMSRRSRVKRFAANAVLLALPLIIAYVAVGWDSQSKVFAPIKTYRSVTDGTVDPSTLYRDLENYNLLMTMRLHPVLGIGFGQGFLEVVTLPDISSVFREFRYIPHNAILGLWAFAGPLGFTGLFLPAVIALFFAARSYRLASTSDERTAALMTAVMLLIYVIHCWGDMGFTERRTIFLVGPVLAIAGQLAYRTGAYRTGAAAQNIEGVRQ